MSWDDCIARRAAALWVNDSAIGQVVMLIKLLPQAWILGEVVFDLVSTPPERLNDGL